MSQIQTTNGINGVASTATSSTGNGQEDFDSMLKRLPTSVIRELAFISSQKSPSSVDELLQLLPIAASKAGVPQIMAQFNLKHVPDASANTPTLRPSSSSNHIDEDVASSFLDKLLADNILITNQPYGALYSVLPALSSSTTTSANSSPANTPALHNSRGSDIADPRDMLNNRRDYEIFRDILDSRMDGRRHIRDRSRDRDILLIKRERERDMDEAIHKLRDQIRLRERALDDQLIDLRKSEKGYDDALLQETHCLRAIDDVQVQIAELDRKLEDRRKFLKEAQQDLSLRSVRVKDIREKQSKLQVDVDLLKKDLATLLDRRENLGSRDSRLKEHASLRRKSSPPHSVYYGGDRSRATGASDRSRTAPEHRLEQDLSSTGGSRRPPPRDFRDQEIDRYDPRDGPLRNEIYDGESRHSCSGARIPRESRSRTHTEAYMLYPSAHAAAVAAPTTDSYIPVRDCATRRSSEARDVRNTIPGRNVRDPPNSNARPPSQASIGQDIDRYAPIYEKGAVATSPVNSPASARSSNLAAIDRYEPPPPQNDTYLPPYSTAHRGHEAERHLPPARRDEILDRPLSNAASGNNTNSNNSKTATPPHSATAIEVVERLVTSPNKKRLSNDEDVVSKKARND